MASFYVYNYIVSIPAAYVVCLPQDQRLYYFLVQQPARTLVFVNAISTLKKVVLLLAELGIPALGLHAHMQQRQRLKNLDRFKAQDHAVMVVRVVRALYLLRCDGYIFDANVMSMCFFEFAYTKVLLSCV